MLERLDNFLSTITGLGTTSRDKAESYIAAAPPTVRDEELAAIYDGNDLASAMVERVPSEMFREGYRVIVRDADPDEDAPDDDGSEGIETGENIVAALDSFGVNKGILEGLILEGVFGGAILVFLVDDGGDQSAPLDLSRVRTLAGVQVYDRRYVETAKLVSDPMSPSYGKPEVFKLRSETKSQGSATVTTAEAFVHASRCLVFPGLPRASRSTSSSREGWGRSQLEKTYVALRSHSVAWRSMDHLMTDACQSTYKVKDFMKMIAMNKGDLITERLRVVDYNRSAARAVVLDADGESLERAPHGLGGLERILQEYNQRLAAAADQPASILFGMSPAGLNATGESDRKIFLDKVRARQESTLRPLLDRAIRIVCSAKNGPTKGSVPGAWDLEFRPLWQLSELEAAQLRYTQAQTDHLEIVDQVILPEEVALSRHTPTGYSTETQIDRKSRKLAISDEATRGEDDPEASSIMAPAPTDGAVPIQQQALNGAQLAAAQEAVRAVAAGAIPRESGIQILILGFRMTEAEAEALMATAGTPSFVPSSPEAAPTNA